MGRLHCKYLVGAASRDENALAIVLLNGPGLHALLLPQRLQVLRAQHEFLQGPPQSESGNATQR